MHGDELVGRMLGGEYSLTQVLQSGGSATVYRARSLSLETDVAVKVLSPRFAQIIGFRERFHDEARRLAALHHPNLLDVHFFGEEEDLVYIAMRLVPSGSLGDHIRAHGPLDVVSAARLIAQIGGALQLVHDQHMVHLDVKPANVLLGRADWPLVADMGIALLIGPAVTPAGGYGQLAGTPAYMAPEHWQGGPVDGRTDEYSLAVTAYELLSGQTPFRASTMEGLRQQHFETPPPRLRELAPGVPGPVEEVVMRGLAKSPEQRFPRAADFAKAFADAAERTRGVTLETKTGIAEATPNLLSSLALIVLTPVLLATLPAAATMGRVPIALPFQLLFATAIAALLVGVRWHVVGLAARGIASVAGAMDSLGRGYVVGGPLRGVAWRSKVIGSAEGVVNLLLLLGTYRLVGVPLMTLVGLFLAPAALRLVAIGLASLVALIAVGIVVAIARSSGVVIAGLIVVSLWVAANLLPLQALGLEDQSGFAWLVQVVAGAGIVAIVLIRRRAISVTSGRIAAAMGQRMSSAEPQALGSEVDVVAARAHFERLAGSVVDLVVLLLGFELVGTALETGLQGVVGPAAAAIGVGGVAGVVWVVLAVRAYRTAGGMGILLAIALGSPLLLALPVLADQVLNSGLPETIAAWVVGVALLLALALLRRPVQRAGQRVLGGRLDRGLLGTHSAPDEETSVRRTRALERLAGALIDIALLIVVYWVLVTQVAPILTQATGSPLVGTVLLGIVILLAVCRLLIPARRAGATLSETGGGWSDRARVFVGATLALAVVSVLGVGAAPVAFVAPAAVGLEPPATSSSARTLRGPNAIQIVPGVPQSGVIQTAQTQNVYTLSATAGQVFYFQDKPASSVQSDLTWRLTDPANQDVFKACLCGDPGVKTLTRSGIYTLTVGSDGATGGYEFWVWAVPPPRPATIAVGADTTDTIPSPGAKNVYTFSATAGQVVYFQDKPASSAQTDLMWRLTDPADQELFKACMCGDPGVKTLARAGQYTLTVGNDTNAQTGPYEFWLWDVPPPKQASVGVGATIADAIPSPGARNAYTFSATAGQVLYFQDKPATSVQSDLKWRLADSLNQEVFNKCLCGDAGVTTLTRGGSYTLTVGNDTTPETGGYEFWIWEVPPPKQAAISIGEHVSDAIPSPGARNVYTFSASAGQVVSFEVKPSTNVQSDLKLRLVDPANQAVFDRCLCVDPSAITLGRGGTYTVIVGNDTDPATGPYEFQINPG